MEGMESSLASKARGELSDGDEFHDALDEQSCSTVEQETSSLLDSSEGHCRTPDVKKVEPSSPSRRTASSYGKPRISLKQIKPQPSVNSTDFEQGCKFTVSQTSVGLILGKNGQTLKQIQEKSGCEVSIDQTTKANGYSTVKIKPGPGAARARELIDLHSEAGSTPDLVEEMEIEQCLVAQLIGPRGATINHIKAESGAAVTLDQSTSKQGFSRLRIAGCRGAVASAKCLVQEKLREAKCLASEACPECMKIDQDAVGVLIGNRGETLKELQRRSRATLDMDQSTREQGFSTLRIFGDERAIGMARKLISAKVAEHQEAHGVTDDYLEFRVEQSSMGFLIGPKGATIRSIEGRADVHIQVDQSSRGNGYSLVRIAPGPGQLLARQLIAEKVSRDQQGKLPESVRELHAQSMGADWEELVQEHSSHTCEMEGMSALSEAQVPPTCPGPGLQKQSLDMHNLLDDDCLDIKELDEIAAALESVWACDARPMQHLPLFEEVVTHHDKQGPGVQQIVLDACIAERSDEAIVGIEDRHTCEHARKMSSSTVHTLDDPNNSNVQQQEPGVKLMSGSERSLSVTTGYQTVSPEVSKFSPPISTIMTPELFQVSPGMTDHSLFESFGSWPQQCNQHLFDSVGSWPQQCDGLPNGADSWRAQAQWSNDWQWPDEACNAQLWLAADSHSAHINIEQKFVGFLIGLRGQMIRSLSDQLDVWLEFDDSTYQEGYQKLYITGEESKVEHAKAFLVKKIIREGWWGSGSFGGHAAGARRGGGVIQSPDAHSLEGQGRGSPGPMAPTKLLRTALSALLGRWYGVGNGQCYEVSLVVCAQSKLTNLTVRSWPLSEGTAVSKESIKWPIKLEGDDVLLGDGRMLYLDAVTDKEATWLDETKPNAKCRWTRCPLSETGAAEKTGETFTSFGTLAKLFGASSPGIPSTLADFPLHDSSFGMRPAQNSKQPGRRTSARTNQFQ